MRLRLGELRLGELTLVGRRVADHLARRDDVVSGAAQGADRPHDGFKRLETARVPDGPSAVSGDFRLGELCENILVLALEFREPLNLFHAPRLPAGRRPPRAGRGEGPIGDSRHGLLKGQGAIEATTSFQRLRAGDSERSVGSHSGRLRLPQRGQ